MDKQFSMFTTRGGLIILAVSVALTVGPVQADRTPPTGPDSQLASTPEDAEAAAEPTERGETPAAVVIEVGGSVEWAPPDVSVMALEGWTPVKLSDRLEPGTQIRTGLRSHVNLSFGDATTVSVRSATHASIDQFYRSATTESVKLGLAYGTIRGGSSEGEVRSDVTVESTVAALLKRGTEGWEMQVEPMTGRFRISLAQYGLVEAIQKLRSGNRLSRSVRPGEYATDANIANMWIKQDIFDRNIEFYESEALTLADAEFTAGNTRGYGTMAPGGGCALMDISARINADFVLEQIASNTPPSARQPTTAVLQPVPVSRPEGNFGTGTIFRVLVPASSKSRR